MVNKPLIRPYFLGGYVARGGWLTSHNLLRSQPNKLRLGSNSWLVPSVPLDDVKHKRFLFSHIQWHDCNSPALETIRTSFDLGFRYAYDSCI